MSGSSVASLADLDAQLLLSTPRYALRRHLHQAAISKGSIAYQDPITFDIIHTDVFLTEHPDLCRHLGERHCPHYTEEEIIKPTVAARAELQQHDVRGGGASPSPHSSDDISDDDESSSRLGSSSSSSSSSSSGSSTSSSSSSSYASEVSAATSAQNNKNTSAIKAREISQAVASSTLTISNKGNQERKVSLSTNTKPDNSNKTATRLWKASPFQRPHGVPFVANDLQKLKSASNNGAKAAAAAAAAGPTAAAAHMVVDIEELRAMPKYRQYSTMHKLAVDSGHDCYRDVATGCLVFCRPFLAQQACCGEDCRHCPYGRHKGRSQLELRRGGDRVGRTPVIGDTRGGASSGSARGGRGVARHYSSSSSSSSDNSSDDEE